VRVEASGGEPGLIAGRLTDSRAGNAVVAGDAVGPLPGRTVAWLAKSLDRALAELGLSLPQYRLLAFLSEGSAAATALAAHLAVSPPSLTALADGLVARGLVERRADVADRRRVAHVVTGEGLHALAAADEAVERQLTTLAQRLPPARRRRAVAGLNLWSQALTAARSGQPR
jgi:long-chain acyl-CoA synthetase